jgi:putative transcriptional regulator
MSVNLTGKLLVASPFLGDDNFFRSVVFMIRHDAEGAFGLAINRPTSRRFRDLVELMSTEGTLRKDDFIYRGGPVEGPLLALHDLAGVGDPCGTVDLGKSHGVQCTVHCHPAEPWGSMSFELANPPAWITGDDDHLRILLRRPDARVRYIAHYSGWGAGQLEHELEVGGWLVADATPEVLFGNSDDAWKIAVLSCGNTIMASVAPFTAPGFDSTLN